MFDLGFSELFLIALVALVVLGPERLPKAARFAGLWIKRARSQWQSVKSEFESQLADEELSGSLRETRDQLHDMRRQVQERGESLRSEFALDSEHDDSDSNYDDTELGSASDPELRAMMEPEPAEEPTPEPAEEPDPEAPEHREPGTPAPTRRDPPSHDPAADDWRDDAATGNRAATPAAPPRQDRSRHDRG